MNGKLLFFSAFLKYPKEIGSIIPSSKFLTDEVLKSIDFKNARCIVEYGPGTGRMTTEILRRARKDAKILCFEINRKFCSYLRQNINDNRVIIINDSAENIKKYLKKYKISKIDYVVSGLPFTNLNLNKKHIIIEKTKDALKTNGNFLVYQFILNSFKKHLSKYFSNISIKFVPLNLPPCFGYVCEK